MRLVYASHLIWTCIAHGKILGHLKAVNFPFGTNGKLTAFRCPNILEHFMVFCYFFPFFFVCFFLFLFLSK